MKQRWIYAATLICAALALGAGVFYWHSARASASGEIVATVDADRILASYPPAVAVNEELAKLKSDSEETLKGKVREKYGSADVTTLPKENQLEIQQMIDEAEGKFQSDVESVRGQKWEPILAAVRTTIGKVAAANGIVVVLQKDAVLYGGVDLTDKVIDEMKKLAPASAPSTTPAPAPAAEPEKPKNKK